MTATEAARGLQRSEATARAALLEVDGYDITLDLAGDVETFDSLTRITFSSRGGTTFLDLKPLRVREIRLNDRVVDADLLRGGRVPLETVEGRNELVVDAVMRFRNDGEGLHRSVDPADGRHYVYGMSFMDAAPSIFACFDQPDLKAAYTFHVRAPEDWVVVGNAPGTNPEPGRWEIGPTQPLSTYFVTLVAGPYAVLRDEHDGIPLGLSARASLVRELETDADELFTMTKQCFDEFHRLFGIRYPFGDYHQAFVPEFNAGAMENPGCVTFRDLLIFTSRVTRGVRIQRATTVAHEMAHQWFGNIVTPRWWDDLWLNESFAEYLGNRVTADVTQYADAMAEQAYARRTWGLLADLRPSTHPVAGNGEEDATAALQNFDGISYTKGSSILKQLNARLGDEVFFAGVVDHMTRHRFGNATMHDLVASWERAGGGDLSAFTDSWLRTAGPDRILLDRAAGTILRVPPAEHPADRRHTIRVASERDGRWEVEQVVLDGPATAYDAGDRPVLIDPYEDSWGAVEPDALTVTALRELLPGMADGQLRAAVWNGVKSALRSGALDPADALALVEASPPVEDTEDTQRRTMAWVFHELLPVSPSGARERLHHAVMARLASTEPGSEMQLTSLRAAIASCTDPDRLRSWLAATPPGISLDLDLRWRILGRLATVGAADRAELRAALEAEPTAVSRVQHTAALASIPDEEAKAFAWDRFTGVVDVSNYELTATGFAMWRGGQEELVAPYVGRYFDELPATVAVRSGWVLADAAEAFFPTTPVDAGTVERARALIADPALDASMRRRVIDETDDLVRRLAVRAAYPHP
ncbi:MAG: aminopeptidase N [Actinobacteria bacterium]|uniref:Unannotated protein n=1 Tax=freshwater metagenome TaxID=449393 RepID=A0A6J6QT45_9ZZZZ|nr:aminopeptidase N [Actinomycetota bacterium]